MEVIASHLGTKIIIMTEIESKHAIVSRAPYILYMSFVDMRNFLRFVPEDKKKGIQADSETISFNVQGFKIGVKLDERVPYSRLSFKDNGAPFNFNLSLHFDSCSDNPDKTDFHIELSADLNFMMKMMLGSKLKDGIDKVVDGLVAVSEGRMPDGIDPSAFPEGFTPDISKGPDYNDGTSTV